ncbi:hypothetical protein LQZ18_10345 [Lachnospiraceae bacterium ZAX-1]
MINEYLFLSDEHRAKVETYNPDGITVEVSGVVNTPLWVAIYSLASKNEDSAKKLSDVHTALMEYSPLVLSCESSEYYNRILFPLINELERKLRKLLYLAASISDSEKAKESIKQLEEKEFGEIFDLLFIDQNFIFDMKKRINAEAKSEYSGRSKYSKSEIKVYVDSLVEHTLWDTILGEQDVPTLRSRFRDVQTYRNDVMHAHNIGKELFGKARYLFDKINKELDTAIDKLTGDSEDRLKEQKTEVNTAISSALAAMDLSVISNVLKGASLSPTVLEMSSQRSKVLEGLQPLGASVALSEEIKGIQFPTIQPVMDEALKGLTPTISSSVITEALKGMNAIANSSVVADALKSLQPLRENSALVEVVRSATVFRTSPAMESIHRQMNQLSELMRPYQQMADILQPYSALQESLRSIAGSLPHNLILNDDDSDEDKPETDNEKLEEDNPND